VDFGMKFYVGNSIFLVNSFTFVTEKYPIIYVAPKQNGNGRATVLCLLSTCAPSRNRISERNKEGAYRCGPCRKLQISKSYLSQILKGEKPITLAFLDKLQNVFKINLKDTDTFTDHRWLKALAETEYPDFSAKSFLVTYRHLRTALRARSMIIKAQGKLIEALQEDNESMAGMLDKFRSVMLEAKLKNPDIDTHH